MNTSGIRILNGSIKTKPDTGLCRPGARSFSFCIRFAVTAIHLSELSMSMYRQTLRDASVLI